MKARSKVFCFLIVISIVTQIFGAVSAEQANSKNQQLFPIWSLQKDSITRLCGFINQSGKIIIKPKYTVVYPFSDGVAWVGVTPANSAGGAFHKWQLIDTTGKVLFENAYIDKPSQFKDGICQVETPTKVGNTSTKNKVYIDKKGTVLFKKSTSDDVGPISEDLLFFASGKQGIASSKYGFINKKGNSVIEQKYFRASSFSEGLAAVSIYDENERIKAGFIDQKGNEIIKFQYDSAGDFINGYAPIAVINDFYSVSNNGVLKINDELQPYSNRFPIADVLYRRNNIDINKPVFIYGSALYGFINKKGDTIIEPQYSQIHFFREGYSAVCKNNSWGFIDTENNKLTDFIFSDARSFKDGLAAVLVVDAFGVNKWGFIDKKGKIAISPEYDEVGDFNNGLAAVKTNNTWGFINSKGAYIVKPAYKMATDFNNGLALVTYDVTKPQNQYWYAYINISGKIVWKSQI